MKSNKAVGILFLMLHVVLCLDFGCKRFTKYASIVKMCNRAQLICFAVLYSYRFCNTPDILFWWFSWTAIGGIHMFFISFILSHVSDKNSYCKTFEDLSELDLVLGTDVGYYVNIKLVLLTVLSILLRMALDTVVCYFDSCFEDEVSLLIVFNSVFFYVTMVVSSFIFYSAYSRLKILNKLLRSGCHEVFECLNFYKSVVNSVENTNKVFGCVYLSALVYKIIDVIVMIYWALSEIRLIMQPSYFFTLLNTILDYVVLSLPAIAAGSLNAENEKIQPIIQDRLLLERGGGQENMLQLFSEYVAARPLQLQLARVLRLDWALPLHLLNLCIAYQITLVQLTHLF